MGIMNHNAVIATTWCAERADALQKWIDTLSAAERTLFAESGSWQNGYRSFVMMPDGSKEGWGESAVGDSLRMRFMSRLVEDNYDDDSSPWKWVEVGFGEYGQKVLQGNCKNCYSDAAYAE